MIIQKLIYNRTRSLNLERWILDLEKNGFVQNLTMNETENNRNIILTTKLLPCMYR